MPDNSIQSKIKLNGTPKSHAIKNLIGPPCNEWPSIGPVYTKKVKTITTSETPDNKLMNAKI